MSSFFVSRLKITNLEFSTMFMKFYNPSKMGFKTFAFLQKNKKNKNKTNCAIQVNKYIIYKIKSL